VALSYSERVWSREYYDSSSRMKCLNKAIKNNEETI